MDNETTCKDKLINGNCTIGVACISCQADNDKKLSIENMNLNTGAKVYVPKNKRADNKEENLNFNLKAEEYVPRPYQQEENADEENPEEDVEDDMEGEELDMIMKDIIDNEVMEELEDDESDEEKWFPKYKDCECCKGFVYKCNGAACKNMNICYCKMKEECDEDELD